jgi:hypothetical protein
LARRAQHDGLVVQQGLPRCGHRVDPFDRAGQAPPR